MGIHPDCPHWSVILSSFFPEYLNSLLLSTLLSLSLLCFSWPYLSCNVSPYKCHLSAPKETMPWCIQAFFVKKLLAFEFITLGLFFSFWVHITLTFFHFVFWCLTSESGLSRQDNGASRGHIGLPQTTVSLSVVGKCGMSVHQQAKNMFVMKYILHDNRQQIFSQWLLDRMYIPHVSVCKWINKPLPYKNKNRE